MIMAHLLASLSRYGLARRWGRWILARARSTWRTILSVVSPARRRPGARQSVRFLVLALLAVPLVIALLWGAPLGDDAYATFAHARDLATGRELVLDVTTGGTTSPLFVLLWAPVSRLGLPVLPASVVLSALGWSVTALALYGIGRSVGRPRAAVTAAIVTVLNPLVASTLGTEVSWTLALFWIAVWLAVRGDWQAQGWVLALMLWVHPDWILLSWTIALLGWQWHSQRRFPLWSALVLAAAVSSCTLVVSYVPGLSLSAPRLRLAGLSYLRQLLSESDWYWLGLPLVGLGLLTLRHRAVWMGLVGCLLVAAGDGALAGSCIAPVTALLAGLGVDWCVEWIETRALVRPIRLGRHVLSASACVMTIALLPLGIAQISSQWHRYRARPLVQYGVEQHVGNWLSAHSETGATVLGSSRIGYLADRAVVAWNGASRDQTQIARLIGALNASPPEYCVSTNTVAWDWLTGTGWFQERYELLGRYETAYDARSPVLVWGYRTSGFDQGQVRPVDASLSDSVRLVGSRHWPERIEPGDTVYATLYYQATQAPGSVFQTQVRMFSPTDGANWGHQDRVVPFSMPVDWWQEGLVIAERYTLTTTGDTPVGAYPLDLSVPGTLAQGVVLGYVSVPWRGTLEGTTRVEATFADQIRLLGFEAPDTGAVGTQIHVTLYWEAIRPPDDDYTVFVHLVGPTGQPATGHDGIPMDRRYPTLGWIPGDIVPDTHPLPLEPSIPAGRYTLEVGMYLWPDMERLPARDGAGIEQTERAIVLSTVEIQ